MSKVVLDEDLSVLLTYTQPIAKGLAKNASDQLINSSEPYLNIVVIWDRNFLIVVIVLVSYLRK
jgi:hypothetical protein